MCGKALKPTALSNPTHMPWKWGSRRKARTTARRIWVGEPARGSRAFPRLAEPGPGDPARLPGGRGGVRHLAAPERNDTRAGGREDTGGLRNRAGCSAAREEAAQAR